MQNDAHMEGQFICTVTQYYGLAISRGLGVILHGSMKTQLSGSQANEGRKGNQGKEAKKINKMLLCYILNPWCIHLLNGLLVFQ